MTWQLFFVFFGGIKRMKTSSDLAPLGHLPQRGRLVYCAAAQQPCLPLWGRWLAAGKTDEVLVNKISLLFITAPAAWPPGPAPRPYS